MYLKVILELLANVTGIWKRKQELNNTPEMQRAKIAQNAVGNRSRIETQVAAADLKAAQNDLAE